MPANAHPPRRSRRRRCRAVPRVLPRPAGAARLGRGGPIPDVPRNRGSRVPEEPRSARCSGYDRRTKGSTATTPWESSTLRSRSTTRDEVDAAYSRCLARDANMHFPPEDDRDVEDYYAILRLRSGRDSSRSLLLAARRDVGLAASAQPRKARGLESRPEILPPLEPSDPALAQGPGVGLFVDELRSLPRPRMCQLTAATTVSPQSYSSRSSWRDSSQTSAKRRMACATATSP